MNQDGGSENPVRERMFFLVAKTDWQPSYEAQGKLDLLRKITEYACLDWVGHSKYLMREAILLQGSAMVEGAHRPSVAARSVSTWLTLGRCDFLFLRRNASALRCSV